MTCTECGTEVPTEAKFCGNCGTQIGVKKDVYQVSGDGLVGKVKEILKDAKVKRIVIKDDKGKFSFRFQSRGEQQGRLPYYS